jgi:hypothetical protein
VASRFRAEPFFRAGCKFLGEGTQHFGCRLGLRFSFQSFNVSSFQGESAPDLARRKCVSPGVALKAVNFDFLRVLRGLSSRTLRLKALAFETLKP